MQMEEKNKKTCKNDFKEQNKQPCVQWLVLIGQYGFWGEMTGGPLEEQGC